LPLILVLVWLTIAGVGGPTFGKLSEVISTDQASFLPADAASTKVREAQLRFEESQYIPAIVVIESEKVIDRTSFGQYAQVATAIGQVEGVAEDNGKPLVIGPIPAKDQLAVQYIVPVVPSEEIDATISEIRTAATDGAPDDTKVFVTGPAGLSADLSAAFSGIDGILLGVALAAVFVILLVVYRSLFLPVLVLINSVFALCAAILVVFYMAKNGIIELNGQSQGILFILVIGAATDYSLLLIARYKEAINTAANKWDAMKIGIKTSFEPILASAATVVLALLCLLLSDLNSNRSLGPIAATGIVFSFLATITFLPALLLIFGRFAFWPSKVVPQTIRKARVKTGLEDISGIWLRVGKLVQQRPRRIWMATLAVLLLSSFGLFGLRANGVSQTDLLLTQSNARDGLQALGRHFDAGAGAPVLVQAPESRKTAVAAVLNDSGVLSDVQVYVDPAVSPSKRSTDITKARAIDGVVLFSATLTSDPYGTEAQGIIAQLRNELSAIDPAVLVGGTSALALDTVTTA
ncbi:MAG TPA: MMPL family transporter, partial [Cellvibrio sp.]